MADSGARALRHLLRAAEELVLALGAGIEELGERTNASATLYTVLRAEECRWRARAAGDPAAARVADVFGALADVFAPETRRRSAQRDTRRKFDPPRVRWDTRPPWRS